MRKILFFPVILALCVVDSVAFGAASRSSRGGSTAAPTTQSQNKAPTAAAATQPTTSARSATRTNVAKPAATAARSATTVAKKPVASTGQKTSAARAAKTTTARAGTTQKAINLGTKVESAKENTVISQECQDAYYGCMDAFCMLDNTSGGRCQCSDRSADLDKVLEEILKLDEQSYALATEGVERIQLGDNADLIMSRAQAAADKVAKDTMTAKEQEKQKTKQKRTLDLSAWTNNSLFSDEEEVDIFTDDVISTSELDFANKNGDELHSAAAKLCTKQLPDNCRASSSVLQLAYAQKIKSDCSAYENSLKQQRNSSQQKLQTAQKALRDAALEMYENENKYDLGQCVVQFKQCLQTTAECGTDYSGCIADIAILQALYNGNSGNVPTTAVPTGQTTITISSATYDILINKGAQCESVTKQCVNANQNGAVWKTVLKDIMPTVYTAEYSAASNSRMNCISTIVSCVQKTCGSMWDETSDNYDACLSNPESIDNYCKLEYARCGDSASQDNVRSYVMAKLAALRVDKCTQEVKECLLSEDRCGEDYSGCIGFSTDTIVDLCAEEKLIACQSKFAGEDREEETRNYIARVAQGLAINIDNSFATTCQNAANAAIERICGGDDDTDDDETCSGLAVSDIEISDSFKWQYCRIGENKCFDNLNKISDNSIKEKHYEPRLTGLLNVSKIKFDESSSKFIINNNVDNGKPVQGYTDTNNVILQSIVDDMNRNYALIMGQIDTDTTIERCVKGRKVMGIGTVETDEDGNTTTTPTTIGSTTTGSTTAADARFPNLLDTLKSKISNQILDSVLSKYNRSLLSEINSGTRKEMQDEINERYNTLTAATDGGSTDGSGTGGGTTETPVEDKFVILQCRTNNKIDDVAKYQSVALQTIIDSSDYLDCNDGFYKTINDCFSPCVSGTTKVGKVNQLLSGLMPDFCSGTAPCEKSGAGGEVCNIAFLFSKPGQYLNRYSGATYTESQVEAAFGKIKNELSSIVDYCSTRRKVWYLVAFKLDDSKNVSDMISDSMKKVTIHKYQKIDSLN